MAKHTSSRTSASGTHHSREDKTSPSLPPAPRSSLTSHLSTDKASREPSAKGYAGKHLLSPLQHPTSPGIRFDGGSDTDSTGGGAKRGLLPSISPVSQVAAGEGIRSGLAPSVPKTTPAPPVRSISSGPKGGGGGVAVSRSSSAGNFSAPAGASDHSLHGANDSFVMPMDEDFMGEVLKSPGWSNSDLNSSDASDSDDSAAARPETTTTSTARHSSGGAGAMRNGGRASPPPPSVKSHTAATLSSGSTSQQTKTVKEGVGFGGVRAAETAASGGRRARGNMFASEAPTAESGAEGDRRRTRGAEANTTTTSTRKGGTVRMTMEVEVDGEGGPHELTGSAMHHGEGGESHEMMSVGVAEGLTATQRRQFMRGRTQREEFFGPIPRLAELVTEAHLQDSVFMDNFFLPGAPCSWLCCAALALSYTTGVPITLESILHVNRMSVHNISLATVTLAVMFDTTMDYINNRAQDYEEMIDERRHRGGVSSNSNNSSFQSKGGTKRGGGGGSNNNNTNTSGRTSPGTSSHRSRNDGHASSSEKQQPSSASSCEANRGSQVDYSAVEKISRVRCKMATFDTELYESTAAELETLQIAGENPPVSSLAQFRKELLNHINDENALYVFNYNPYVVEQSELHIRSNMADTDEEMEEIMNSARYTAKHPGTFGILLDFNATAHTVTIATPHLTSKKYPPRSGRLMQQDKSELPTEARRVRAQSITTGNDHHRSHVSHASGGNSRSSSYGEDSLKTNVADHRCVFEGMVLEIHMIPLQTFYESVSQVDPYTGLSRGYIQVYSLSNEDGAEEQRVVVPTIFPLFVLDGSSSGGLITSMLDVSIAPHILGLSMMHYLAITFLLSSSAQRKQSSRNLLSKANVCDVKLRGIPLTKVIQQLYLPVSMVVSESNRASVATAFVWYSIFLAQLKIQHEVYIGLILPERRGNSEDGEPNIDEDTFRAHLKLVIRTTSVMLIGFNVNLALNVTITQNEEPAHFAIVIGFDETHNVVRLADVNVNRFRKTWNIPFERLYNATMGYGYIVAAKDKKTIRHLNAKEFIKRVLRCARYGLPPPLITPYRRARFEYPARPYAITVLADAVERLGFESDTERFLNFSGYHISYFLSSHLPLEGAVAVLQNYSHYALDDAMTVTATHFNYYDSGSGAGKEEGEGGESAGGNRLAGGGSGSRCAAPHRKLPLATRRASAETHNPHHHIFTPHDLQRLIEQALQTPDKTILLVNYDRHVIADSAVWNGSDGGDYAIVLDWDERNQIVTLSDANPATFYRTFACPLALLFRATCTWREEHQSSCGTIRLSRDGSQAATYENTRGYDMAHALVHHPFRPIFSATCNCLALAATEMMMNLEMPEPVSPAGSMDDEERERWGGEEGGGDGGGGHHHHFISLRTRNEEDKRKYQRYNNVFSAEDILYTLPSFNVNDWKTRASDTEDVVTMANRAFATLKLPLVATDALSVRPESLRSAHTLLETCKGVNGLVTVVMVLYDTDKIHGIPGTSMALVNRVEEADADGPYDTYWYTGGATMQLVEGDPCRWGVLTQRSADELLPAVLSIIYIEASANANTGNYN